MPVGPVAGHLKDPTTVRGKTAWRVSDGSRMPLPWAFFRLKAVL
jgi:hypothetical protein